MADSYATTAALPVVGVFDHDSFATAAKTGLFTRGFSADHQEGGGGGSITRPLTGLLHPPDRRGNRAQSAA